MGAPAVDGGTAFGRRSGSLRLGRCRPAPGIGRLPQDWVAARAVYGGAARVCLYRPGPWSSGIRTVGVVRVVVSARRRGSSIRGLVGDR